MTLYWYDTIERVGTGSKRHIYRANETVDHTVYSRVCGATDGVGASLGRVTSTSDLTYVEHTTILNDPNACERCLRSTGLDAVRASHSGADSVGYDPFGVFDPDDSDPNQTHD